MFRVGDVVEREGLGGSTQHIVKSINPEETHISIDDTGYRYLAVHYKLISPVWYADDKARITKQGPNFGHEFIVFSVSKNCIFDPTLNVWRPKKHCERIGLAPKPAKPPVTASYVCGVEEPTTVTVNAAEIQPSDFKTTLARETEIPTYLYDVVEVKPRLIPGNVAEIKMTDKWSARLEIGSTGQTVAIHNIDHIILDAERLRQLAKLCTDLADLMG